MLDTLHKTSSTKSNAVMDVRDFMIVVGYFLFVLFVVIFALRHISNSEKSIYASLFGILRDPWFNI